MELPSKGLIIRRNWLELILANQKHWEMRSSRTSFRGRFALIEGGAGAIRGEAYLEDSLESLDAQAAAESEIMHRVSDYSLLEKWRFPWVLSNIVQYDNPIQILIPRGAVIWVNLNPALITNRKESNFPVGA